MIHLLVWKVILHLLKHNYPKKFGLINLNITHENQSNNIVIATFAINHFAHHHFQDHGLSEARMIPATIIHMKHATKIKDTIILDSAHTIVGNALVVLSSLSSHIQSQIIGKHVFNLIQLQVFPQVAAFTYAHPNHQNHNNTANIPPNKYDNIFPFIILYLYDIKLSLIV